MHLSEIVASVELGWYINLWKILPLLVLVLIWAKLMTWADKDAVAAHLPRTALNSGFLAGMILAFALFLALPGFAVAIGAFVLVMAVEIAVYLMLRNQKVGLADLSKQFKAWVRSFTSREKEIKVEAGSVMLFNKSGAPMAPPESDAPELAGYVAVQGLLTDPLRRSADRIEMKPTEAKSASVKYWVDG
ncbi:MAG TPA: hypothetical protein VKK61_09950, partial [Tepidisphaeraceae bacterium]|nr:hypothetical protein [Tepidisphaeraceae bacterium]